MSSISRERLTILQRGSASSAKLDRLLRDFYNSKIKGKPVNTIRENTQTELDSILSHFMIESYSQQANSINDKFKALPYYDLGLEDHSAIDNVLRVIEDKFYFKIGQVETRNQGIDLGDITDISLSVTGEINQKNELDPLVYINGIATGIIFGAANLATKTVPPVIINKLSEGLGTATTATPERNQDKINYIQEKWQWIYVTMRDINVCDNWERACRPLDGKVFDMLDPDIPNPPYDRHIHCRCSLVLIKR